MTKIINVDKIGQPIAVGDWCIAYENHELQYGQILKINRKSLVIQIYSKGGHWVRNPNYNPLRWVSSGVRELQDPTKPRDDSWSIKVDTSETLIKSHVLKRKTRNWQAKPGEFADVIKIQQIEEEERELKVETIKVEL